MFVGRRIFFLNCGGFFCKYFFYLKIIFYFCGQFKKRKQCLKPISRRK